MHFDNMLPFGVRSSINLNEANCQLDNKHRDIHQTARKNTGEEGKPGHFVFSKQTEMRLI